MTDKLDLIIQQNEQLVSVLATLIRTLESKGVFTKKDFEKNVAFGKQLQQMNLVFGIYKK